LPENKDDQEKYFTELEVMKQLSHTNIVKLVGYKITSEEMSLFLVLYDYNLFKILKWKDKQGLSWFIEKELKDYCKQILSGLAYLHNKNIAHRDIKSTNIMVFLTGIKTIKTLHIADFGVSKYSNSEEASTIAGTNDYMAPEVYTSKSYNAFAADVYSFGILIFEMLTGSVHQKNIRTQSKFLSQMVEQCTQIDPNKRPTTASLLQRF